MGHNWTDKDEKLLKEEIITKVMETFNPDTFFGLTVSEIASELLLNYATDILNLKHSSNHNLEFFCKIDWELLKSQKEHLLNLTKDSHSLNSLLHGVIHLQIF